MIDQASRVYQSVFGSTLTFGLELAPAAAETVISWNIQLQNVFLCGS